MAVVSLSRIQLRRGKTNGQPLPQLASGELAWAIDTQELYIGNGATAEGAPYVGNTRILTENDNIFENYQYKNLPDSQARALTDRLDDYVSLKAFEGINDTVRLQNAINNLYGNNRFTTQAVILYVEPGTYTITNTINLPPYTRIQGAGVGRTIFKFVNTTDAPVFRTSTLTTVNGIIHPKNIYIDGVTFDVSSAVPSSANLKPALLLEGMESSKISNSEIIGNPTNFAKNIAITLNNLPIGSDFFVTKHNIFDNVTFRNCVYGTYSDHDLINNTWKNCVFENNTISVFINNVFTPDSPENRNVFKFEANTIENCWFDKVAQNAIKVVQGLGNVSRNNKYKNVGNEGLLENGTPLYPVVDFGQDLGGTAMLSSNSSNNDWFSRTHTIVDGQPYISEVRGNVTYESNFKIRKTFRKSINNFINFPLSAYKMQTIEVTYQFKNDRDVGDIYRYGKLTILVNAETGDLSTDDQSGYIGNPLYSSSNITFEIEGRNYSGGDNPVDTLVVTVVDLTPNTGDTDFYYSVKYIN